MNPPYKNAALSPQERTEDLLSRMTLAEKLAQMTQICVGRNDIPENVGGWTQLKREHVGSALSWLTVEERNAVQREAVEQTRLGIPILFAADVIHGLVTIYPIPLAQACSFNPELVKAACSMAAKEALAKGLNWTFAPTVDVPRDPRWGRVMECFGEDPYLTCVMADASVRGYQDDVLGNENSILACLKHFIGYAESEGGRDYRYTDISSRALYEVHLPPYKAGIEAGAATVMSAFNDINGTPASGNRSTLTDVLRGQLGFEGLVVSDWRSIEELVTHGMAEDEKEAAEKALYAGVDMDMMGGAYERYLERSVEEGTISPEVIDEAVRRILRVKFQLGLFERPYAKEGSVVTKPLPAAHRQVARALCVETFVLLKNNDGLLPLKPEGLPSVAVIGPGATADWDMYGAWGARGREPENVIPILDGIQARAGATCHVRHAKGCDYLGDDTSGFDEAVALAEESTVVIACIGEPGSLSGENKSRANIDIPGVQIDLLRRLKATGKPLVVVLTNGRPLCLEELAELSDALLDIWLPGVEAGPAVADVLFGDVCPSGKLAMTFPRHVGQIPIYVNQRQSGRPTMGTYLDCSNDPLYEYGYGLSYTTFEYSDIRLSKTEPGKEETLRAEITVTNTGNRTGKETVLWYIRDHVGTYTRPLKELKHFEKQQLAPGESRTFVFEIVPERDLAYPDNNGGMLLEPGLFTVFAGMEKEAQFRLR